MIQPLLGHKNNVNGLFLKFCDPDVAIKRKINFFKYLPGISTISVLDRLLNRLLDTPFKDCRTSSGCGVFRIFIDLIPLLNLLILLPIDIKCVSNKGIRVYMFKRKYEGHPRTVDILREARSLEFSSLGEKGSFWGWYLQGGIDLEEPCCSSLREIIDFFKTLAKDGALQATSEFIHAVKDFNPVTLAWLKYECGWDLISLWRENPSEIESLVKAYVKKLLTKENNLFRSYTYRLIAFSNLLRQFPEITLNAILLVLFDKQTEGLESIGDSLKHWILSSLKDQGDDFIRERVIELSKKKNEKNDIANFEPDVILCEIFNRFPLVEIKNDSSFLDTIISNILNIRPNFLRKKRLEMLSWAANFTVESFEKSKLFSSLFEPIDENTKLFSSLFEPIDENTRSENTLRQKLFYSGQFILEYLSKKPSENDEKRMCQWICRFLKNQRLLEDANYIDIIEHLLIDHPFYSPSPHCIDHLFKCSYNQKGCPNHRLLDHPLFVQELFNNISEEIKNNYRCYTSLIQRIPQKEKSYFLKYFSKQVTWMESFLNEHSTKPIQANDIKNIPPEFCPQEGQEWNPSTNAYCFWEKCLKLSIDPSKENKVFFTRLGANKEKFEKSTEFSETIKGMDLFTLYWLKKECEWDLFTYLQPDPQKIANLIISKNEKIRTPNVDEEGTRNSSKMIVSIVEELFVDFPVAILEVLKQMTPSKGVVTHSQIYEIITTRMNKKTLGESKFQQAFLWYCNNWKESLESSGNGPSALFQSIIEEPLCFATFLEKKDGEQKVHKHLEQLFHTDMNAFNTFLSKITDEKVIQKLYGIIVAKKSTIFNSSFEKDNPFIFTFFYKQIRSHLTEDKILQKAIDNRKENIIKGILGADFHEADVDLTSNRSIEERLTIFKITLVNQDESINIEKIVNKIELLGSKDLLRGFLDGLDADQKLIVEKMVGKSFLDLFLGINRDCFKKVLDKFAAIPLAPNGISYCQLESIVLKEEFLKYSEYKDGQDILNIPKYIKNRTDFTAVPKNSKEKEIFYSKLEKLMNHITSYLLGYIAIFEDPKESDARKEESKIQIDRSLKALYEASAHCATRWFKAALQEYFLLSGEENLDLTDEERVQSEAQKLRYGIAMEKLAANTFGYGLGSVHRMNQILNLVGKDLGISDDSISYNGDQNGGAANLTKDELISEFFSYYTPSQIMQHFNELVNGERKVISSERFFDLLKKSIKARLEKSSPSLKSNEIDKKVEKQIDSDDYLDPKTYLYTNFAIAEVLIHCGILSRL